MKIGILGGSFDPIHKGHLNMAVRAYEEYGLDQIWLIPAGHSPNKNEADMTPALLRLKMAQIAVLDYPFIKVSDIEIKARETSYTSLTLEKLTGLYPQHEFYFIMGGDSLDYFDSWHKPETIASLATILVVARDEFSIPAMEEKIRAIQKQFNANIKIVHCDKIDISSTAIRTALAKGQDVSAYVPCGVCEFIKENNLYGLNHDR